MKLRLYISLFTVVVLGALFSCGQSNQAIESTLQNYKKCLQTGDTKLIKEITDESFRVGIYQQPISNDMFASFIETVQAPDSIYWDAPLKDELGRDYCQVYYIFGEKELSSRVTFSKEGRLLLSEWLDKRGFNMERRVPSEFVGSIPFEMKNGKIVIKASLNNTPKKLNMLFDTGADGMALRTDLQTECNVKITRSHTARVPGGEVKTNISGGNNLILDSLTISNQNLVLFDTFGSKDIDGIIGGSNFFRKYITEVDFEDNVIRLYTHGAFSPEGYKSCDMTYANGVPTVPFIITKGDRVFESNFIFDTGAGYEAIMFGAGMKEIEKDSINKYIPTLYHSYNYSIGHKSKIVTGLADNVKFANMTFHDFNLAMEPYNEQNHGRHNVLGSIGLKSLSRFNWIVDLTSYKVYSKTNSRTNLPMAFELKGYIFEYLDDYLRVIRLSNPKDNKDSLLKPRDFIKEIGGVSALDLTYEKLNEIKKEEKIKFLVQRNREELELILE